MNHIIRSIGLTLLVSVLFTGTSSAQFRIGAKVGATVSNLLFHEDIIDADNVIRFQAGPVIECMFGAIGFEAGLLYSQRGTKLEDQSHSNKVKTEYLDIPVNLKLRMGISHCRLYFTAGPYASFLVSGDKSINMNIQNIDNQWETKSLQAGLNAGIGVEVLSHIQLGLNHAWSLTEDFGSSDFSASNRTWSITAAYLF